VFLIFHCAKDDDHSKAMKDLGTAFSCVKSRSFELSKVSITACLTLLWQYGDRHYQASRWDIAVDWFLGGTHQLFRGFSEGTMKCYRKAALCYIQQREYASAAAVVRLCPGNEAATHYITLLTSVKQGLEDDAVSAVKAIVGSPDFDRRMLLLATSMAHESDMKNLLLTVLEALLRTLKRESGLEADVEAITLVRCIVRLVHSLLDNEPHDRQPLVASLLKHFRMAKDLISHISTKKGIAVIVRDISWLWRMAYNSAVKGCSTWECPDDLVSDLFDISRELLEAYRDHAVMADGSEVHDHIACSSFAAIAGRVFALRRLETDDVANQVGRSLPLRGIEARDVLHSYTEN